VLVHAASSGVGTALIQLIKFYGGFAIALCGDEKKMAFCEKYLI